MAFGKHGKKSSSETPELMHNRDNASAFGTDASDASAMQDGPGGTLSEGEAASGANGAPQATEVLPSSAGDEALFAASAGASGNRTARFDEDVFGAGRTAADYAPEAYRNYARKKKGRGGKIALGVLGGLAGALAVAYLAGTVAFSTHFYPNTTIAGADISLKSVDEAAALLDEAADSYQVSVAGQGINLSIASDQAKVDINSTKVVSAALGDNKPYLWFLNAWGDHDESGHVAATMDSAAIRAMVDEAVAAYNEQATPSADAAITYNAETKRFEVTPEVYGNQVDAQQVYAQVADAIQTFAPACSLTDDVVIKPQVLASDPRLSKGASDANQYMQCNVNLKSSDLDMVITTIDGEDIKSWITFDENYSASFDEAALNKWATDLADSLDTIGATRTYTRPGGKEVTVSGGDYGWETDPDVVEAAVKEAVSTGATGDIEIECESTGNGYTKPGMDWGAFCDVDLSEQWAYYYDEDGDLLWDAPIVSGNPNQGDDTPTGVYWLKNKQSPSTLKGPIDPETNKPKWESVVTYWMPFVGNLIGLHDATWQPSYVWGDSDAFYSYGSHGCVNLSYDSAEDLWYYIEVGDPVIVHW